MGGTTHHSPTRLHDVLMDNSTVNVYALFYIIVFSVVTPCSLVGGLLTFLPLREK